MAKPESISMPIEEWSGRTSIDCTDETKLPGDDLSNMAEKSHGDGIGGGRDSGDKMDASGVLEESG